jgi:hypothetical protein
VSLIILISLGNQCFVQVDVAHVDDDLDDSVPMDVDKDVAVLGQWRLARVNMISWTWIQCRSTKINRISRH